MNNNQKFNASIVHERSSIDKIIGMTQHDLFMQTTPLIELENVKISRIKLQKHLE